ncbi:hypothetical protein HDU83_007882 [Entophlyctis luteolus]|nr:hypothetical protein HDU82_001891 [Entophlyctis luteolus]KAJ3352575.1 hypothetical protein HDU83_007882 [Entophlyctis luteolus]
MAASVSKSSSAALLGTTTPHVAPESPSESSKQLLAKALLASSTGQTQQTKPQPQSVNHKIETEDILGQLPQDWERAVDDESGRVYFVNHKKKSTSWIDPRTFHLRKHNMNDIVPGELPYGWEEIYDNEHNVYYFVDHQTEKHYWNPPWLQDRELQQKDALPAAEKRSLSPKTIAPFTNERDTRGNVQVQRIKDHESHRRILSEGMAADALTSSRKSTLSKEDIETTVRELRAQNERLEAEHNKLLSDQKSKNNELSEIRELIESERSQRLALETYIIQVKHSIVEKAAENHGEPAPELESFPAAADVGASLTNLKNSPEETEVDALRRCLELERAEREELKEITENLLKERAKYQYNPGEVPDWVKDLDVKSRNNRLKLKVKGIEDPERLAFKAKKDLFAKVDDLVKLPRDSASGSKSENLAKPRETGFGQVKLVSGVDVAKEFD